MHKTHTSMIRTFTTLILTIISVSFIIAQTSIGGVINSYAKVTIINNADVCNPTLTVDDASPFNEGDHLMIIQMKGAEMDTTNTNTFGNIINLNSAGLYEKTIITQIAGNEISIATQMVNNYDVNSSVQIVNIPQYTNAIVTSSINPYPWDGEKGGIIAFEVENILTLNANIIASFSGFRGGVSDVEPINCSWTDNHDLYFYPDNSPLGDSKGEGIAEFYPGKENGRGPQATGGGGGNNHNSGGGGGANFGTGGAGGLNLNPTPLQCLGQYPGVGGYGTSSFGNRLFLGGGGGSGHTNNGAGTDGGSGGGIIYIKATTIEGYWNGIISNGKAVFTTPGDDGAGGGGAGGSILVDADNLIAGLGINALGGNGGNTNLLGNTGCMGPGGGGGGGIIFTDLDSTQFDPLYILLAGGQSGVVTNSSSPCNGNAMGADNGSSGILLSGNEIAEGNTIEHISIDSNPMGLNVCVSEVAEFSVSTDMPADSYQWQVDDGSGYTITTDGVNYSGSTTSNLDVTNLPPGIYTVQCMVNGGCNDMLLSEPATLEVLEPATVTLDPLDQTICESEAFVLSADASGENITYQWQVDDGTGFVDVMDNATFSGATTNELSVQADAMMEGYLFQCIVGNDCPATDISNVATISINPLPVADFTFYVSEDSVFVENTSSGYDNYYWDFGAGEPLEPGGAPYYIFEENGTYYITIYAVNECGTTSATYPVTIDFISGIFDTKPQVLDFVISPNPTSGIIQLDMSGEQYHEAMIRIYSVAGHLMSTNVTSDSILSLDLSEYAAGTYFVQVVIEGKSFTKKLVKQ